MAFAALLIYFPDLKRSELSSEIIESKQRKHIAVSVELFEKILAKLYNKDRDIYRTVKAQYILAGRI